MFTLGSITYETMALTQEERNQLFAMLKENASIINKLVPNLPLIQYILTGHTASTNPLIVAYKAWETQTGQ